MKTLITLILAVLFASCSKQENGTNMNSGNIPEANQAREAITRQLAIAPNLPKEDKAKIKTKFLAWVQNSVHNDRFTIFVGESIFIDFTVLRNQRHTKTTRGLLMAYAKPIKKLVTFLDAEPKQSEEHALINYPRLFSSFSRIADTSKPAHLLLFASPFYEAREKVFSTTDGLVFPNDSCLLAKGNTNPWSVQNKKEVLKNINIIWAYPQSHAYKAERMRVCTERFLGLYIKEQSGTSLFTSDFTEAIQNFEQQKVYNNTLALSPDAFKEKPSLVKLRLRQEIQWMTEPAPVQKKEPALQAPQKGAVTEPTVPTKPKTPIIPQSGGLKIAILWDKNISADLDLNSLYKGERVYYTKKKGIHATYYKDHTSSTGKDFELIEFKNLVRIHDEPLEVYVNIYSGKVPVGSTFLVKIQYAGKVYSAKIPLKAIRGNCGGNFPKRATDKFWSKVDVKRILGINK